MEASDYQAAEDNGINLLDYLPVLWKYKLWIAAFSLASAFYALISGLISPRVYESAVSIVRDSGGGEGGNPLAVLAQQFGGGRGLGSSGKGDNVLLVLRSRTMAEYMVKQLKLQEYYGARSFQAAVGMLRKATKVIQSRDGPIAITVEDQNPDKPAEIANAYPENLNRLMSRFSSGVASRQRVFVIERLKETEKALYDAEETLKEYQLKNRTVVVPTQTTEAIGASAGLRGQLIATEIELKNIMNYATDSNPEVIRLRRKIGELKRQMSEAQYGGGIDLPAMNPGRSQREIYLPAAKVPEVVMEHNRLMRDVKTQETVYNLLTQQLEQAKIAEAQEVPVVQILDAALPPGELRPVKLGQDTLIYGIVAAFLSMALAILVDYATIHWPMIRERLLTVSPRLNLPG
jgi:uncharacterized protein involved in exopolysaccharide biosynthesis